MRDPLRHHGDAEIDDGLIDFAVNVFPGGRPDWLEHALHDSLHEASSYPRPDGATDALARLHGRDRSEVLPTAGAAEAFGLIARLRRWRRPVVIHPQFTEPHAALEQAGHHVDTVICRTENDFALDGDDVPEDADLIVLGNPTNPTGRLHRREQVLSLARPGRVLVIDEAFMDAVPGQTESLAEHRASGVLVLRSLTKHWSIPGIRAGYVIGDSALIATLAEEQTPWSVSTPALAAMVACSMGEAMSESHERALLLTRWRAALEHELRDRDVEFVPSSAPFVLARIGGDVRTALRDQGVAVRRADTFPGLEHNWARIAVRPPDITRHLLAALDHILPPRNHP